MYRAYHAFRGRGLSNQEGQTTHAVYVFVTMLRKLINDHQPAYIAASFDLAGPTFRDEIVTDYKANRAAMPDDLAEQINWVHQACEALGVPIVTAAGYEADDVIGTMALRARDRGLRGRDRLDRQGLLPAGRPGHPRLRPARGRRLVRRATASSRSSASSPEQVTDVLALVGDTSDNVAGVPGIGKKGAIDLVTQFGSLDAMLERLGELKPKQREALSTHRDDALRSRELVTIRTDVPLDVDFESLRYRGASRERCYELFTRLDFRTLVNDYAPPPHRRHASRRTTRWSTTADGARRAGRRAARRPASSRSASFPTSRPRCARASSASRSRRATGRRGTCRSAMRTATRRGDLLAERVGARAGRRRGRARAAAAAVRGRADSARSATT